MSGGWIYGRHDDGRPREWPRCELRELEPREFDPTAWPWKMRLGHYNQTSRLSTECEQLRDEFKHLHRGWNQGEGATP